MSNKALETRLFSSSVSWNELLERAQRSAKNDPDNKIGIAETSAQLLIIELNLKIILSRIGVSEDKLKGKNGHKLAWLYSKLDDYSRKYIYEQLKKDEKWIIKELSIIDGVNGTVGWRYLTFVDDIKNPTLEEHFCGTLITNLVSLTNYMVFKVYADGKKIRITKIANKKRSKETNK